MDHEHEPFNVPGDPLGRPVDGQLLGQFVGAAYDGCTSCQDALMTLLVEDATTTARLVEVACMMTAATLGGLPASMTDPAAPGPATPEFRLLARTGLDGQYEAMSAACAQLDTTGRRAAANTAADTVVGYLHTR